MQVVALSATLSNPGDVVQQFVPHGVRITVAGGRGIETIDTPEGTWAVESALPSYLKASGRSEKTLVFANSRIRVDSLTADLRRDLASSGYTVVAHHGSLDRSEREATEEAVKARSRIVVVATATLEIGIDIGDIDLVVLDGPPPDIPSLLQRIGRGNRRRGTTRVMVCNSGALEALVSSAMIAAARESWLGTGERGPQYAVARQQTASYVFQAPRRARPRAKIQELLDCCATPVVARGLLDSLLAAGELLEDSDGIRLGDHWLEASSRGEIHSCIEDVGGSRVVDELTGRVIAHAVRSQSGPGLQTGGHLLQVRQWSDFKIEVRRTANVELAAGHWRYGSRPRMQGSGQPEAVRRYLGVPDSEWPVVNDDRWAYCFHFGGARRRSVLDLAAHVARASEGVVVNDWYMRLGLTSFVKPSWLTSAGRATLDIEIASRLEHLERVLGRPRANVHLPLEARIDEVRGWLQIDIELEHFRRARLAPCTGASLRRVLESLVASLR